MVTPLGVLKDTPESYNPKNLKQIGLMVLDLQPIVISLKDRVKQQALSLFRSKTGTFKRNSSYSLRDRVTICKQVDLVDSCFSFFGFEITASTLIAKNLFTVSGPPAKRDAG